MNSSLATDRIADGGRPVVVFDAGCGFCRRQVRTVAILDWARRFDHLPYDDAVLQWSEVARGTLGDGLRVRFPTGGVTVGVDAVRSIAIRLPITMPLAPLLWVPGIHWLAGRAYGWIAARRQRETCRLPTRNV